MDRTKDTLISDALKKPGHVLIVSRDLPTDSITKAVSLAFMSVPGPEFVSIPSGESEVFRRCLDEIKRKISATNVVGAPVVNHVGKPKFIVAAS
jgi:hypothetical protein